MKQSSVKKPEPFDLNLAIIRMAGIIREIGDQCATPDEIERLSRSMMMFAQAVRHPSPYAKPVE
jgi:hypothetical protein